MENVLNEARSASLSGALISSEEAAKVLGLRPQTLSAYRHEGRGPRYYKIGRRCLYRREDLEDWIAARVVEPGDRRAA